MHSVSIQLQRVAADNQDLNNSYHHFKYKPAKNIASVLQHTYDKGKQLCFPSTPKLKITFQHPDSILSNLSPQIALLFYVKLRSHHVECSDSLFLLISSMFQHQGQDQRCHWHLKEEVPNMQGQLPESTPCLHQTHCRYFKEPLLHALQKQQLSCISSL